MNHLKSRLLNYDPGALTVGTTLDLFTKNGMKEELNALQNLVNELKGAFDEPTCQNPTAASIKKLRSLLRRQRKSSEGTRYTMIRRLNESPDTSKQTWSSYREVPYN